MTVKYSNSFWPLNIRNFHYYYCPDSSLPLISIIKCKISHDLHLRFLIKLFLHHRIHIWLNIKIHKRILLKQHNWLHVCCNFYFIFSTSLNKSYRNIWCINIQLESSFILEWVSQCVKLIKAFKFYCATFVNVRMLIHANNNNVMSWICFLFHSILNRSFIPPFNSLLFFKLTFFDRKLMQILLFCLVGYKGG